MTKEIKQLNSEYYAWLKDKSALRNINGWVEITTPYIDSHNDYVQIYVQQVNDGYILSDDGYTIKDLEEGGCTLDSPKRQQFLKTTLNGFGVELRDKELRVHSTAKDFSLRKHSLIQAILAVNDMFYLSSSVVKSVFIDDVEAWLNAHEIRYIPKITFHGKSRYNHTFHFVIPKSSKKPERIVQAINRPERSSVQTFLMAWTDTKEARDRAVYESTAYALLNDSERVPSATIEALENYEIKCIRWSARDKVVKELAA